MLVNKISDRFVVLLFLSFQERSQLIDKQYNTDREKLQKIRLLMVTLSLHSSHTF